MGWELFSCTRSSGQRDHITAKAVSTRGHIPIRYHRLDNQAIAGLKYERTSTHVANDPTANIWHASLLFSASRPAWSGMMQAVHIGEHPPKSSVIFLPMIDMSSSDPTCIYSTLIYVAEHAERHDQTPVITFDQPLWCKELSIQLSQPAGSPIQCLILRLGPFHMEMSFLGSIGHIMAESGFKEFLELIYAPKVVEKIMTGKAISRAVRAHLLLDAVLNGLLLAKSLDVPLPRTVGVEQDDTESSDKTLCTNSDLKGAESLYDELMAKTKGVEEVANDSHCKDSSHPRCTYRKFVE